MEKTPKENAQIHFNQISLDGSVALRRKTKVPVKLRKITREKVLEEAFTYRIPMEVTRILDLPHDGRFPVCPRCRITIEREYMSFCDRCGQKLGWSKLKDAIFVYPGYYSIPSKTRSVTLFSSEYIYSVKQTREYGFGKGSAGQTNTGA